LLFNFAAYVTLWFLVALRVLRYPQAVLADLSDHGRGVGFFTTIAATCVLGSQCILIAEAVNVALGFWILGIVLWIVLIYGILTLLTVRPAKPPLIRGLNGGWLVAVVAAHSVSILGSQLTDQFAA